MILKITLKFSKIYKEKLIARMCGSAGLLKCRFSENLGIIMSYPMYTGTNCLHFQNFNNSSVKPKEVPI